MKNSNQLHGHARVRREGGERTLDEVSIGRLAVLDGSVPSVDESMVREFALNGGSPTVAVTAEEQAEFRQLMRQMEEEYRAAISGDDLTDPTAEAAFAGQMQDMNPEFQAATSGAQLDAAPAAPGYASTAEALNVQTQRLGGPVVRSLQAEDNLNVANDGINPPYLATQGEVGNA